MFLRLFSLFLLLAFLSSVAHSAPSFPEHKKFEAILFWDASKVDLARAKLEFDRLIDPNVDVEARLAEIDGIA